MDSIKRYLKTIFRRFRRSKDKGRRQPIVDPEPPSLPPLVPRKESSGLIMSVPDFASPGVPTHSSRPAAQHSPQDPTHNGAAGRTEPSAVEHTASAPKDSQGREADPDTAAKTEAKLDGEEEPAVAAEPKNSEKSLDGADDRSVRTDSANVGQSTTITHATEPASGPTAASTTTSVKDSSAGSNGAEDDPLLHDYAEQGLLSKHEQGSSEETAAKLATEKMSVMDDLPPMKKIVLAPGMSATSGPLEDFPGGGDFQ